MTNASNALNISRRRGQSYSALIGWAIGFFVLLLLRDSYSVGVNKYIFLAMACVCALSMKSDHLIYLFCFLFPLYVGLPGNYMTLMLLARLFLEVRQFKASSFALSIAVVIYIFIQNVVTGYTGIVPMMFIPGVLLVLLLFAYRENLDSIPLIVMYSAGVAALGFIMLVSTLRVYDLNDLLSSSFRLGTRNADYVSSEIMRVSVDPNYFGMFAVSSLSTAFPLAFGNKTKPVVKVCLYVFVMTQLVVGLIGLSRAFTLVSAVWLFLYLVSQKNIKALIIVSIVSAFFAILLMKFMPNVIEALQLRFEGSDMATGNGRITGIQEFWNKWSSSLTTMIFGVGLYNCNVHCMPLQFLFGGGLVMFCFLIALFISYCSFVPRIRKLLDCLPFIVTFTMMCSVPTAGLLNFMFPLVFIGLCTQTVDVGDCINE